MSALSGGLVVLWARARRNLLGDGLGAETGVGVETGTEVVQLVALQGVVQALAGPLAEMRLLGH